MKSSFQTSGGESTGTISKLKMKWTIVKETDFYLRASYCIYSNVCTNKNPQKKVASKQVFQGMDELENRKIIIWKWPTLKRRINVDCVNLQIFFLKWKLEFTPVEKLDNLLVRFWDFN